MAYDTSQSNPNQPQGTVGGGNVFNAGSLFGNVNANATSSGNDGNTPSNSSSAALGGNAASAAGPGASASADNGSNFWTTYGTYILAGAGVLAALIVGIFGLKVLRKKK